MQSLGRHALLDLYGCNPEILNDCARLESILKQTAVDLDCTVVEQVFHRFAPHGVSGVVVIAESHLAIHTWPECGYAAVDLFTCSETTELAALTEILREQFEADEVHFREESRGIMTERRLAMLQPRAAAAT
ncbi:MAG: adenosylmethionine decarboxylase [Myxococcota bacterium]